MDCFGGVVRHIVALIFSFFFLLEYLIPYGRHIINDARNTCCCLGTLTINLYTSYIHIMHVLEVNYLVLVPCLVSKEISIIGSTCRQDYHLAIDDIHTALSILPLEYKQRMDEGGPR
ncbi:hypothetical protein ACJX0J_020542, partial [Zea mays]